MIKIGMIGLAVTTLSGIALAQPTNIKIPGLGGEVAIAINPVNQFNLIAGSNLQAYSCSNDGGYTWTSGYLHSTLGESGDPCVLFDVHGIAYYAHLSYYRHWLDCIVVQRSMDGGMTWDDGVAVGFDSTRQQDKDWLATDLTNSPYRGNLYLAWTEFDSYGSRHPLDSTRILFSTSTDSGSTWSKPVRVSDVGGNCLDGDSTVEGAIPAVGPDGEVYLSWAGPLGIMFNKSIDGGKTFGKDIFVTSQPGGWDFMVPGMWRCNGLPTTACDISDSRYRGNIYVMWSDQRNGADKTDVFFIRSTDGGETWKDSKMINNDSTERQHFLPAMTVDQSNGYIYILFYDGRNTIGDSTDVFLARSTDGGDTFSNYQVTDSSFTPDSNAFIGDYIDIAARNGSIYPIWMRWDSNMISAWTAPTSDSALTGIRQAWVAAERFKLFQNYPNPFNPSTVISYQLPMNSHVTLRVYDVLGRPVRTLVDDDEKLGSHEVTFDASNFPSGVYFYRLQANGLSQTKKLVLLR